MQLLFDLVYREKGEKKSRQLKIDFVSNYMRREIGDFFQEAHRVSQHADEIKDNLSKAAALKTEKPEGWKEQIDELETERDKMINDMKQFEGMIYRNIDLAIDLLKDNGVKDETLLTRDFWDRCIEPAQTNAFLAQALYKDSSKKKGNI